MRGMLASLVALLTSAGILLAGGGLSGTLVAVRANIDGFSLTTIGLLMSSYYLGFIGGCYATPGMVRRAGHIRAFTALAAIAAVTMMTFPLKSNVVLWIFLRVIMGFCFAGLYMIIESWINEKATNDNRGKVLSVYRIVDFAAMTIGQYLLVLADPKSFVLFSIVAMLITISIVPVAMTRVEGPSPPEQTQLGLKKLMRVSPLALSGAFAVGFANSAFWAISPVFVQQLGYGAGMVATFMSAVIVCGAVAQWPIGSLSDLVDRRLVLIGVSGAAALAGVFLMVQGPSSAGMLILGAALFGVFAMPVFGLSAAYANDFAEPHEFVAVSGGLLLVYGVGSVFGPIAAPIVMNMAGPSALFGYTALIHVALVLFGLYRLTQRDALPPEEQGEYVPVPRTTPAVFEIDPRATEEEDQVNDEGKSNDGAPAAERDEGEESAPAHSSLLSASSSPSV